MNRREWIAGLTSGVLGIALAPRISLAAPARQVAITMDDFNLFGADEATAEKRNEAILSTLRAHSGLKAAIFVAGKHVDSAMGRRLLKRWNDEGHILCNHTYSHRNYEKSEFAPYAQDVLRCEQLIGGYPQFRRLFRFPMLKEGRTAEHRDRMRVFLTEHGYKNGAVTIDTSDWYIDQRLRKRLASDAKADTTRYRDYYLEHIQEVSTHYDGLCRETLGRSVKHTLLVHHNVLNELYLPHILNQFEQSGWQLIDAEQAFTDKVFDEQPATLPAGNSLILSLALQAGQLRDARDLPEGAAYEQPKMDRKGL
jgi:peptidoglycan/xylan/chitin deacetylase (PgdA/CDA1 family)